MYSIVNFLIVFIFIISFHSYCECTILTKGKITMCVKDKNQDPFNVVDGKGCEKKLVLTKAVSAGQVLKIIY